MVDTSLQDWKCNICKGLFSDPLETIPVDKVCVSCNTKEASMRKVTSTGTKPAESIKDILARDTVSQMSTAEQMEYLKLLGFSISEIEAHLQVINVNQHN
jgi:hypothetical protein